MNPVFGAPTDVLKSLKSIKFPTRSFLSILVFTRRNVVEVENNAVLPHRMDASVCAVESFLLWRQQLKIHVACKSTDRTVNDSRGLGLQRPTEH